MHSWNLLFCQYSRMPRSELEQMRNDMLATLKESDSAESSAANMALQWVVQVLARLGEKSGMEFQFTFFF